MADKDWKDMKSKDIDAHRKGGDVPRELERGFGGTSFAADEEEQTRERERAGHDHTDEVGEITETELDEDV
jgi:hypothetical protein